MFDTMKGPLAAELAKIREAGLYKGERVIASPQGAAVRLEDGLVYTEPSEWHYPPRHALGAALLAAGTALYVNGQVMFGAGGWMLAGITLLWMLAQGR